MCNCVCVCVCVCVFNGLPSHHGGYEIDPYCSNGHTLESDSVGSGDPGGGEDGTLQAAYTQPTGRS